VQTGRVNQSAMDLSSSHADLLKRLEDVGLQMGPRRSLARRLRVGRLAGAAGAAVVLGLAALTCLWIRGITDSRWPDLSVSIPAALYRQQDTISTLPADGVKELQWTNRQGLVPGRVTAQTWQRSGRTYYRVAGAIGSRGILCEGIFKIDGGYQVYQFRPDKSESVWYDHALRVIARSALPTNCYQSSWQDGTGSVTFWTPVNRRLGNLAFYYHNSGSAARLSMDLPGRDSPLKQERWILK